MIQGQIFFITGLPRSRTAWLANFLSYGNTVCHHDLWASAPTVEDFRARFEQTTAFNLGNSDAANALHQDALLAAYPDAKWIIVNRPIGDVHASCRRAGSEAGLAKSDAGRARFAEMETLQMLARKIEELRGKVQAVEFDFDDLRAGDVSRTVETFLPGWHCPVWRQRQLNAFNVQTHAPAAMARLATMKPGDVCPPEPPAMTEANRVYLGRVRQMCGSGAGPASDAGRAGHEAFAWFVSVLETALVWDHCWDGDGVSPALADRVFTALTTEWPLNDWWLQHRAALVPALVAARSAWKWSNRPDAPKFKSYDLYTELPAVMAWLIGGNALVEAALPGIRECALALLEEDERRDGGKK